jgi:hypothetical protein
VDLIRGAGQGDTVEALWQEYVNDYFSGFGIFPVNGVI